MIALAVGHTALPVSAQAAVLGAQGGPGEGIAIELVARSPGDRLLQAHATLSVAYRRALADQSEARAAWQTASGVRRRLSKEIDELSFLAELPAYREERASKPAVQPGLEAFAEVLDAPRSDIGSELARLRAELAAAEGIEAEADGRVEAAEAGVRSAATALRELDEQAWTLLGRLGVSPQALEALREGGISGRPGALARGAGLLEIWLGAAPERSAGRFTPAELYAFVEADRPGFAEDLRGHPPALYASPYDVLYAGTGPAARAEAVERASRLAETSGYRPMAGDLVALGRLSPEAFGDFEAFLTSLSEAGLRFERRYHGFGALQGPVEGEASRLLTTLPWQTEEGRQSILRAAAALSAKGQVLRPSEASLLALIGQGTSASERALAFVRGSAPLQDPRDGDYAVFVARDAQRYGAAPLITHRLEAVKARLGRSPRPAEAAQLLEVMQAGTDLSALIPEGGSALPIGDLYAWERAPEAYAELPAEVLRARLDARVGTPTLRLDSNAEYAETSSAAFAPAKLVKMHLLLDALEDPEVREHLIAQLQADLMDGARERGGLVRVSDGKASFEMLASISLDPDRAAYLLPTHVEPLNALARFHFHAVDAHHGERLRSGPSSVGLGQGGDVGVAYLHQQDEVVISATKLDEAGRVLSFGVDFLSPEGAVRDLGTFSR